MRISVTSIYRVSTDQASAFGSKPGINCMDSRFRHCHNQIRKSGNSGMKITLQFILHATLTLAAGLCFSGCASTGLKEYQGKPFQDSRYQGGPQKIPGRIQCAYYDLGGEGVAYH